MAKPDPALLDPRRYPFACEIPTRFGDLDLNGHVNNVAVASLVEESRVRFNSGVGLAGLLDGATAMVASQTIDFLGQARYPAPVRGLVAVERLGQSSWTTIQLLLQEDRAVTFARAVLVCVREGAPVPLPAPLRPQLERWGPA